MGLILTYLGHSTILVESDRGGRVLVDPWLNGNPGCPYTPATVPAPDAIAVTHGAWDHLGDVLELLERFPHAALLCARDVRAWAKRRGVAGERIKVMVMGVLRAEAGFQIRAVETRHGSFIDDGEHCYSDVCVGYIIGEGAGATVYHMGDTSIFSDLKLIGELYRPQVTLVPIGSAPGAVTEMSPQEAAMAAAWAAPEVAVPFHYQPGVEDHLLAAWQAALAARAPRVAIKVMTPGGTLPIAGGAQR